MKGFVVLFFFTCSFLLILWVMYFFNLLDKRVENRINYYFDIDKNIKKVKKKKRISLKEGRESLKVFNEILRDKLSGINQEKIENMLKSAGVMLTSEEFIMMRWVLVAIFGGTLYLFTNNLFFLLAGGLFGYMIPRMWVNAKIKEREKSFNEGLPEMISTVIGSLRSGYSFSQALKTVVEECDSPIRDEIGILMKELSYGVTMEEGLNNLIKRMPSGDLELMIQATLIQRQVGGNLAEVLEIIVSTIRERNRIERQVQTLTAQGRLSGRVIGGLPVALGLMIYMLNPEYMTVLFTNTVGIIIISIGAVSGIAGFLLINKITKVEV